MSQRAFLITGLIYLFISFGLTQASVNYSDSLSLKGTLLGALYGVTVLVTAWILTHGVLSKAQGASLNALSLIKIPLLLLCLIAASSEGKTGLISFVVASLGTAPSAIAGALISERLR